MTLIQWAIRWGIPAEALAEYREMLGMIEGVPVGVDEDEGGSETAMMVRVGVKASQLGGRLWRNNVGAAELPDGTFLRYGLLNGSKRLNRDLKSSDRIGIKPVVITPEMVGSTIGQFWAREGKKPGWVFTGTPREMAQLKFLEMIFSLGGDAAFITSEEQLT